MEEDGRKVPIPQLLVVAGTLGIVISIFGRSFLGERIAGLFLPALILLFIGRSMNRGRRRREIEDLPQASPPRPQPRESEKAVPPPAEPRRRNETASSTKQKPTRSQVDADLEKALAAYRKEPDLQRSDPATLPPAPPADMEFQPKTSAEMIEEAKRRLKQSR